MIVLLVKQSALLNKQRSYDQRKSTSAPLPRDRWNITDCIVYLH